MKGSSLKRVTRIIAAVRPKVIIAEGTAAFDTLRRKLAAGPEEVVVRTDWRAAKRRGNPPAPPAGAKKVSGFLRPPHPLHSISPSLK